MAYLMLSFLVGMIVGVVSVASNPSPYFGALGLVLMAGAGCGCLVGHGGAFLAVVLFLIYLGGMLVVFAYCAALAAEPYPEAWGDVEVFAAALFYFLLVFGGAFWFFGGGYGEGWASVEEVVAFPAIFGDPFDEVTNFSVISGDSAGVGMLYSLGGGLLVLSAWVLLLTLFVVLEVTRGLARGALRAV
nr:NADH dehydrogenase subunit 6 [Merluccius albidus]